MAEKKDMDWLNKLMEFLEDALKEPEEIEKKSNEEEKKKEEPKAQVATFTLTFDDEDSEEVDPCEGCDGCDEIEDEEENPAPLFARLIKSGEVDSFAGCIQAMDAAVYGFGDMMMGAIGSDYTREKFRQGVMFIVDSLIDDYFANCEDSDGGDDE